MTVAASAAGPSVDAILRRLELAVTRRLDGLLQGDYRGLVPGHGSETGETRPYVAGDDVRRIDWNVSARSIDTQVRETIADRELETWVLVDRSASLDFGTAEMTKAELSTAAVAAVGHLTARTGNRFGAVVVDSAGAHVVPARPGRNHLLAVLRGLVDARPMPDPRGEGQDRSATGPATGSPLTLADAVGHLLVPPRRRGLMVIVSDFVAPSADGGLPDDRWERPISALATRHDVVAIEIVDPRELELPAVGMLAVVDPETGRTREVPTNRSTRQRYAAAAASQRADIADRLRRAGADHVQLRTDRDWVIDLASFVIRRRTLGIRGAKR